MQFLNQFASQSGGSDLFSAIGIDWTLLAFQAVAFLLLVWLLGKFVFPIFMRIIDERQARIEESLSAAREAEDRAASAQGQIDKLLRDARSEAKAIVSTAKDEASAMIDAADEKAIAHAEHLIENAHDEIAKEVLAAKKALHNETIELIAQASEKVIGKTYSNKVDSKVVKEILAEAK